MLREGRGAVERGDLEALRRAAHSLKNSGSTLGALRLCGTARELEALARSGTADGAAPLLDRAEAQLEEARTALETTLGITFEPAFAGR